MSQAQLSTYAAQHQRSLQHLLRPLDLTVQPATCQASTVPLPWRAEGCRPLQIRRTAATTSTSPPEGAFGPYLDKFILAATKN